jgi:hypothetical protein
MLNSSREYGEKGQDIGGQRSQRGSNIISSSKGLPILKARNLKGDTAVSLTLDAEVLCSEKTPACFHDVHDEFLGL